MTSSAVLWHAFTAAFLSVTQVVLICGLGFFSRKYKLVSNDDLFAGYEFWKTLAKVLVIMINPCFVVATFVNYIDRDQLGEIYLVALLVSVFTLYWYFIGNIGARACWWALGSQRIILAEEIEKEPQPRPTNSNKQKEEDAEIPASGASHPLKPEQVTLRIATEGTHKKPSEIEAALLREGKKSERSAHGNELREDHDNDALAASPAAPPTSFVLKSTAFAKKKKFCRFAAVCVAFPNPFGLPYPVILALSRQRDWVEGEGLNTAIGMLSNAVVIFAIWTFGVTMLASLAEDGAVVEKERRESRRMEMGVGGAVENKTEEELPCPLSPPGVLSRRVPSKASSSRGSSKDRPAATGPQPPAEKLTSSSSTSSTGTSTEIVDAQAQPISETEKRMISCADERDVKQAVEEFRLRENKNSPSGRSFQAQHDGGDDDEGRRTRPGPAVISALAALSSSILGNGFVQAFVNHPCVNAFTIAQTLAIVLSLLHPLREAYLDSIVFEAQFMVGQALVPMTLVVLGATLSGRRIFGSRDDQIPKKKKADHEPVPTSCRSGGGAQAQAEEEVAASSVPRDEFDLTVTGAFVIVLLRVLVANVCSVPLIYFLWKNEIRPFGEDSPRIVQSRNMALYFFILCASPPASNINLVCVTQDVMVRPMAKVFTLSQFTSIVTITLSVTVAVALLDDA